MLAYNSEDIFNPDKTPEMVKELTALNEGIAHTPVYFKAEIIISYLKNHSLKNDWINANPKLAELMISNSFVTVHIESLFEFCRSNHLFLHGFESYITKQVLLN